MGAPAAGWAGEFPMDTQWDDWEPAIAADPNSPFVYVIATRYAAPKPCPGNCPSPWMAVEVSPDGGATWGKPTPLCACQGKGQFDPIVEVVPSNGNVYALYMNGFNVMFTKSTDHGAHWSAAVKTYGTVSWNDKPVIAMSDNGQHVFVSFNGPTGGDPYVAQSHDSGATWTQTKLVDSNRYYFAFDADVAPNGTVYFAESSLLYGGGGNKGTVPSGAIDYHAFVSTNNGTSWTDRLVGSAQPGVVCDAAGCPPDYYFGHTALSVDGSNNVVYLYDGAATFGGPQTVVAKRSTNGGATWSAPVTLSAGGENAVTPAVESRGNGDVRASTTRPRAEATTTPGTSGIARRPTAGRRGRCRPTSPISGRARRTRRRPALVRSTATTARSRSRTRARRSRPGARARATTDRARSGSTARTSPGASRRAPRR